MTLQERVESYAQTFKRFPDSVPRVSPTGRWLTGMWMLGNNYKGTGFYGQYPPSFLKRVQALFPDHPPVEWLHLFSGSLSSSVPGIRVDVNRNGGVPTVQANVLYLPFADATFQMIAADPPYTAADAQKYATKPVNKPAVLREAVRVLKPGGHLLWLDTQLPMYSKQQWFHWGMICIQRSTNHRTRLCSLFTRQ